MFKNQRLMTLLGSILALLFVSTAAAANEIEIGDDHYLIFYHNDALGSPLAVTNHAGNVLWYEHSEPYGKTMTRVSQTGQEILNDRVGTRKGYTGHLNDTAADLVYMKARYYDPQIGRFYSNDPVGFTVSNPMMFNRYAYANNNPYSYVDPDGRLGQFAPVIVGAVAGGATSYTGALAGGATQHEAMVAGAVGTVVGGLASGAVVLKVGTEILSNVITHGVIGGLSNIASQVTTNKTDNDELNDNDINWGSVAGSAFGSMWGSGYSLLKGMNSITATIKAWSPLASTAAVGTSLGEKNTEPQLSKEDPAAGAEDISVKSAEDGVEVGVEGQ